MPGRSQVFPENEGVKRMTELYPDPADETRSSRQPAAASRREPCRTWRNPTRDHRCRPHPGGPRPLAAAEPNYATTDVDPTPGIARDDDVQGASGGVAAHPAVATGRPDTRPAGQVNRWTTVLTTPAGSAITRRRR